jgi:hypothetical protein
MLGFVTQPVIGTRAEARVLALPQGQARVLATIIRVMCISLAGYA